MRARTRQEPINVGSLKPIALRVEFALYRAPATRIVRQLGDEIDARVSPAFSAFPPEVRIGQHARITARLGRCVLKPNFGQSLKVGAFCAATAHSNDSGLTGHEGVSAQMGFRENLEGRASTSFRLNESAGIAET